MNYIWDIVVKAKQNEIPKQDIKFLVAQDYSPYMELSVEDINFNKVETEVEINPYYRYFEIFKDMFNINNTEDEEFRHTLFDIAVHFLADIDIMQGMNKKEFYIRFILKEIESGLLGKRLKEDFELFNKEEKTIIAKSLYRLYITGEMMYILMDSIREIFTNSTIYANYETKDELLFFIPHDRNEINEAKLDFLKSLFLPLKFHTEVYWNAHFGIIGVEETMKVGSIALY